MVCRLSKLFSISDDLHLVSDIFGNFSFRFDVGLLVPQTSPVLALQHVVVPVHDTSRGKYMLIFHNSDFAYCFIGVIPECC